MKRKEKRPVLTVIRTVIAMALLVTFANSRAVPAEPLEQYVSVPMKEGVEVPPLESKTTTDGDDVIYTIYRYRITVPAEGYLKFTVRNGSDVQFLCFFEKLKTSICCLQLMEDATDQATYIVPVSKGKIYLAIVGTKNALTSYQFKKVTPKDNYCRPKAMVLPENKTVRICQTPKYHYDRWYKFKLTSSKRITFWIGQSHVIDICDSHLRVQGFKKASSGANRYVTINKLPAGTCYVRIRSADVTWKDLYTTTFRWRPVK